VSFQDEHDEDDDFNGGEVTEFRVSEPVSVVLFILLIGLVLPLSIVLWKAAL
jgi:hypothetical protein